MQVNNTYVGRFAPSPSGPLHFGSLVAALASFLDARHHKGEWLIRIEDLDPPRELPDAPKEILHQLRCFGLHWDSEPLYQSTRLQAYEQTLENLSKQDLTYHCTCSRRSFGAIYPGTCRGKHSQDTPHATRLQITADTICVDDIFQGRQQYQPETEIGDFIVKRKDGLIAYQLAVVVDDHYQHVTHVIRGHDLLDSTPRQLYIANLLGFNPAAYGHFPVVLGRDGHKLSKQAKAEAVPLTESTATLNRALLALGQPVVSAPNAQKLLTSAIAQWNRAAVPAIAGVPLTELVL
ncbi:MAG: glutamyl-Q tRNA(Asp) synthetase [Candidatus Azotimanducaceae bacterium]|jgi:glutamyl-Q tRNA(Asp) synthetase